MEGDGQWFRVKDGAIVRGSLETAIPHNMFLASTEEYGDFELRLEVRLLGDIETANAGIQFRSRRVSDGHEMVGFQADMGQQYWGYLYDESRRNRILVSPDPERLTDVLNRQGWNEYTIRAEGSRIRLWVNGFQTVDYVETDDRIDKKGIIGLLIHRGPPSEAHYRAIRIKSLDAGD